MYNYLDAVKEDVKKHIINNSKSYNLNKLDETFKEELYDRLFIDDKVTGNESGKYDYIDVDAARIAVSENTSILKEIADTEYTEPINLLNYFIDGNWLCIDVIIRCYMLSQAITDVVEELKEIYPQIETV